jgi:peptidoglycan biosynthesis protein MviN/MurJ (putative lipid II flippase)
LAGLGLERQVLPRKTESDDAAGQPVELVVHASLPRVLLLGMQPGKGVAIGAAFNIAANIILISRYSFPGAAVTTVLSELVLFLPFYYSVRRHITRLPFVQIFWRPIVASAVMGAVVWLLHNASLLAIVPLAMVVYALSLPALGAFTREDWEMVKRVRG